MEIFKISKEFPISENFPKFWKSENFPQILQKSENLPKCNEKDQGSENRPNIWKPENFPQASYEWTWRKKTARYQGSIKDIMSIFFFKHASYIEI